MDSLNTALAMSLLILSLPFHGYFVLGQQAQQRLPIGLQSWYREIEQKLKQETQNPHLIEKVASRKTDNKLTYMDLARLLKTLFEK